MLLYQTLAFTIQGKYKSYTKIINIVHQLQHGMKNFELADGSYSYSYSRLF